MENLKKYKYMYLIFTIIYLFVSFAAIYAKDYWFSKTTPYYILFIMFFCPFIYFIIMSLSAKDYSMNNLDIKLSKILLIYFLEIIIGIIMRFSFNFVSKIWTSNIIIPLWSIIFYIIYLIIFLIIKNKDRLFFIAVDKKFLSYILILLFLAFSIESFNVYTTAYAANWFANINIFKVVKENNLWIILTFIQFAFVAIIEETLFRGMLQNYLIKRFPLYVGIMLQAVLFALSHVFTANFGSVISTTYNLYIMFIYGVVFGITYYKTKSIIYPIFLHTAINLIIQYGYLFNGMQIK
ncbi:MAG: CPBP family intramembrane metalloprotease [Oscillospiraceae bacterium]|nr:CPBP family intramembrane metalloprotease [Oscillospiraceae bacterium]